MSSDAHQLLEEWTELIYSNHFELSGATVQFYSLSGPRWAFINTAAQFAPLFSAPT